MWTFFVIIFLVRVMKHCLFVRETLSDTKRAIAFFEKNIDNPFEGTIRLEPFKRYQRCETVINH